MMKLTEIYNTLKTTKDVLRSAREVAAHQRDVKRVAIDNVIEHYERSIKANDRFECWYTPLVGYRCKKCGGVIMKVVGPFQHVTCGISVKDRVLLQSSEINNEIQSKFS